MSEGVFVPNRIAIWIGALEHVIEFVGFLRGHLFLLSGMMFGHQKQISQVQCGRLPISHLGDGSCGGPKLPRANSAHVGQPSSITIR